MFRLVKWYLDLVSPDGVALIGYAAQLRWGALRVRYASVLRSAPGTATEELTTIRGVAAPQLHADRLAWSVPSLGLHGEWDSLVPPIRRRLLESRVGAVDWCCRMPRAHARLQLGDATLTGLGYTECLRLTLSPWKLPFHTLRWGRYLSEHHAVVWIEWLGESERRWVWLDGVEQERARLTDDGITELDSGYALRFEATRCLKDRSGIASLLQLVPGGDRIVKGLGPLARMREHKLLSRSSLGAPGSAVEQGWSIHEVVTW